MFKICSFKGHFKRIVFLFTVSDNRGLNSIATQLWVGTVYAFLYTASRFIKRKLSKPMLYEYNLSIQKYNRFDLCVFCNMNCILLEYLFRFIVCLNYIKIIENIFLRFTSTTVP